MIDYYAGSTMTGERVHAVAASDVTQGGGWFAALCGATVHVHNTSDAWDWSRAETNTRCVNCRMRERQQ